ncbi:MAG: hypothetical protein ACW7DQ_13575 [Paraglaciecola chathamensis]
MKINELIKQGWDCYTNKVANGLLAPENEKMMQLQLAQIFQTLAPIYEYQESESIKVLLEVPVKIKNGTNRIIDIVVAHDGSGIKSVIIRIKKHRKLEIVLMI